MLSINISELVLTVLNFLLLFFVLDRLLYRPLISFMDARQARMNAGLDKLRAAEDAAQEARRLCVSREDETRREAARLMDEARAQLERQNAQTLDRLHSDEEAGCASARESIERAEQRERAELAQRSDELAHLLAARLIGGQS